MFGPRKVLTLKFKSKFRLQKRRKFLRNLNFTEGQPISLVSLFSGIAELRTAIAKLHGFDAISPEQIIVGTGSKELIFLAMNIFHGGKYKKYQKSQFLDSVFRHHSGFSRMDNLCSTSTIGQTKIFCSQHFNGNPMESHTSSLN